MSRNRYIYIYKQYIQNEKTESKIRQPVIREKSSSFDMADESHGHDDHCKIIYNSDLEDISCRLLLCYVTQSLMFAMSLWFSIAHGQWAHYTYTHNTNITASISVQHKFQYLSTVI